MMNNALDELVAIANSHSRCDGIHDTDLPFLSVIKASYPTQPIHIVQEPAICFILQGRKRVVAGAQVFVYARAHHLVASVDLPIIGEVLEANPEEPYLCLRLTINPAELADLMFESGLDAPEDSSKAIGLELSENTPSLADALLRLCRLLDNDDDKTILAPMAMREILYYVLKNNQLSILQRIAFADSALTRVSKSIALINASFREKLCIAALAEEAGMSLSSFHQHFKSTTGFSPLQFQKRLRLMEARKIVLRGDMSASGAAYHVGYASPSQFNRDYGQLFGSPPQRDIKLLRGSVWDSPQKVEARG